ncbi:MAG: FAD-dependent oxidoreductase [Anaerolineae bacterium]|nr:FAD-binding oxidoreductase [Thermoflexales bacterium]MDW8406298.1 FAD-dependent oxidoreductase [Anaerolineae bacterium]
MTDSIGSVDHDAAVLIIGAGIVGALIASHLAERGLDVAVIDAQEIGGSATRRSIGLATPDPRRAHRQQTARGVEQLTTIARRHRIEPRVMRVLHVAGRPDDAEALRRMVADLHADGIEAQWIVDPSLVPRAYSGGLHVGNSVLIDPLLLVTRLLEHDKIAVKQNVEVYRLERRRSHILALALGYTVRAGAVVLAGGVYAGLLSPYLADSIHVARGTVWRSHPQPPIPPYDTTAILVEGGHVSVAQTAEGRLRLGAWGWSEDQSNEPALRARSYLEQHLPGMLSQTESWVSATAVSTRDGAPLVGTLSSQVHYALSAGAFGLAWAPIIAEQIADSILPRRHT